MFDLESPIGYGIISLSEWVDFFEAVRRLSWGFL
jgi:hypothetical protein